jgi:sterol desaturase/sphingolipid hydroxylase (fatty acid hydroxylase superfamily)
MKFHWWLLLLLTLGSYLILSGSYYLLVFKTSYANQNYGLRPPNRRQILRELKHGIITALIFWGGAMGLVNLSEAKLTKFYTEVDQEGIAYLGISYLFFFVIFDLFLYWAHRSWHSKQLYPWIHREHHLAVEPTPLSSIAFDPLEALHTVIFVYAFVFSIPLHVGVFFAIALTATLFGVINHGSCDLVPRRFSEHGLLRVVATPAFHSFHHLVPRYNFATFFPVLDWIFGTYSPRYNACRSNWNSTSAKLK